MREYYTQRIEMNKLIIALLSSTALFAIEPLVDTAWLDAHKGDKNLRIIEVSTPKSYKEGHIPFATFTSIDKWRQKVDAGFLTLKSPQEIEAEIQRLGIGKEQDVVLYADIKTPKDFLKASYIFWALHYHGIKNVALLDGGKQAWIKENAILDRSRVQIQASEYKVTTLSALLADRAYVEQHLEQIPMLDARPSDKYLGITPTATVQRDGHIKGAMSYSWNYSVQSDYKLKEKNKLETLFAQGYNLDKEKEVLVYCTGGLETSFNYYVLAGLLEYKHVRLYDASMKEWGNREDTPMIQYKYEVFQK